MADDKSVRGPQDRTRVDVNEDYELRYWSEKFRVSKEALHAGVQRVGVMASDVEAELKRVGK